MPRLLLALPQFPHDPASGAARTASTVGELLADDGWSVELLATIATEGPTAIDLVAWLAGERVDAALAPVVHFSNRGVRTTLLDTGALGVGAWSASHGATYDRMFNDALARFAPDLLLTYGGSPDDVARQHRARAAGTRIVFGLYNTRYCTRGFFDHVHDVITPSEFLSAYYADTIGLRSTPLDTPLWPGDTLAVDPDPACVTMVNPTVDKGSMLFAAIARALGNEHPEIPIEVYHSRNGPTQFLQTALAGGVDLLAHPRLRLCDPVASPSAIFRRARVVVVPSLVEDAAPRVVAEALVNGIPPLGSDRGGIPEMCRDAGLIVPVPRDIDPRSERAPPAEIVRPWVDAIARWFADPALWQVEHERAGHAGARYLPPVVTRSYTEHFERVLTNGLSGRGNARPLTAAIRRRKPT